ncbi:hypothetical protein D3C81_1631390 [compost metagenome]
MPYIGSNNELLGINIPSNMSWNNIALILLYRIRVTAKASMAANKIDTHAERTPIYKLLKKYVLIFAFTHAFT